MIPALKSCYVLLNKNFLDSEETIRRINYFPKVGMKNCEDSSNRVKNLNSKTSPKKTSNGNFSKIISEKQVNDSDGIKNAGEDSDLDFTCDGTSSEDDETPQRQERKMKRSSSGTGPKKLSCLLCNETFNTNASYLIHKRSHKSSPYKCILCRKGCKNRQSFLQHMKSLHPEVDPFVCEYRGCQENFKTQKGLEIHRKMHWRFMCKYCKKLFARKHWMKKHVLQNH